MMRIQEVSVIGYGAYWGQEMSLNPKRTTEGVHLKVSKDFPNTIHGWF